MTIPIPLIGASIIGRAPFGFFAPPAPAPTPGDGMGGVDPPLHPSPTYARVTRADNGENALGLLVVAGQAHESSWFVDLRGPDGPAIVATPYPTTAALTAQVYTIAAPPALAFVPHVEWLDPAGGRALLRIRPSQFAAAAPGSYKLTIAVVSGGVATLGASLDLEIRPRPFIPPETP